MMSPLALAAVARWSLFAIAVVTSVYGLLCYLPFTWTNFIQSHSYPVWVGLFVRGHGLAAAAALVPALLALPERRRLFAGTVGAASLALSWPLMSGRIGNDAWSLALSFASWLPLLSWEAFLLAGRKTSLRWAAEPDPAAARARLPAALLAALMIFCAFSVSYLLPRGAGWAGSRAAAAIAMGESLLSHALAFTALLLLCELARAGARLLGGSRVRSEAGLLGAAFGLFAFRVALGFLFGSLSFTGPAAWLLAALGACGATIALLGQARDLQAGADAPVSDAVDFLTPPLAALWLPAGKSLPGRLAGLLLLAASPWLIGLAFSVDWDRVIATFALLAIWAAAFVFFHGWLRRGTAASSGPAQRDLTAPVIATLILLAWGADAALSYASPNLRLAGVDAPAAIRRLAEEELSLRTARRLFRRTTSTGDFWNILHANTNISRHVRIEPRDLGMAGAPPKSLALRPHIFFFVVDSLRPDYLGAYNPKAGFTPAIDSFAKESLVWRRAFTSYGATGLSEPSLWAGARLPHKQYVMPFAPMNSLERLTDEEGYRSFVTIDPILHAILTPSPSLHALGGKPPVPMPMTCEVLQDLSARLRAGAPEPAFSYMQVQDLHVSVINREGGTAADGRDYPGFQASYASRVARIDACFGRFLESLRKAGLYEDSVIVLSSDHGDSLGEGGRGGHAYTIFPEILRVPLILRAPARLLAGHAWDLDAAAFTTDITPTLYELLGRAPRTDGEVLGRPLVASSRDELARTARPERPVVSSYGPVYGVLQEDGRRLYIADGVNFASYYFDLDRDPAGERNLVTPALQVTGNAAILRHIEALNAFYGFRP